MTANSRPASRATFAQELRDLGSKLKSEQGVEISYLRLRALPFTDEMREFGAAHERVYVVEQNRDGQ